MYLARAGTRAAMVRVLQLTACKKKISSFFSENTIHLEYKDS